MPNRDKTPKAKSPAKINPLEQYIIEESVREGTGPDAETQAQIDLLNAEDDEIAEEAAQNPQRAPAARRRQPISKKPGKPKKRR
jgi:hypothetical protein